MPNQYRLAIEKWLLKQYKNNDLIVTFSNGNKIHIQFYSKTTHRIDGVDLKTVFSFEQDDKWNWCSISIVIDNDEVAITESDNPILLKKIHISNPDLFKDMKNSINHITKIRKSKYAQFGVNI